MHCETAQTSCSDTLLSTTSRLAPTTSYVTEHSPSRMADGCGIRIMRVKGVGKVSLNTIVDVIGRLKAERYPSLETTNPALSDYQLSLRRAFLTYGFPQVLTLDHGTVFYNNTTTSPFPTRLHLWLLPLACKCTSRAGMGRRLAVSGEGVDLSSSVPLVPPYSQQWIPLLGRLFLLPGQAGCPSRGGYSL